MGSKSRVQRYMSALDAADAEKLGRSIYSAFRALVAAQHDIADGDDTADERAKGATLALISLATSTAAKVFKKAGARRLAPMPAPIDSGKALRQLTAMIQRRQVSTNGRTWVDYDSLVDADPFESYKHRRGGDDGDDRRGCG